MVENTTTLQGKVDNINKVSDQTGVIASLKSESISTFNPLKLSTEVTGATPGVAHAANDQIRINGVQVTLTGITINQDVIDINAASTTTGVTAYLDSAGKLHLFSEGQINLDDDGYQWCGSGHGLRVDCSRNNRVILSQCCDYGQYSSEQYPNYLE